MPVSDAAPVLTARNLVAGYLPGINILNGMSVDVLRGQVRCVLGPNGTGKSTLLKVLFGFLPAQQGEMRLGATSLHGVASHDMAQHGITYLPQRPSVFPFLSVEVNLRLGTWSFRRNRTVARERIERAYAQFPILAERRRQAAGTLSGGQQRQLEIARALMTDPTVMLIDEPTASIEPRIAAQIYALIAGLAPAARRSCWWTRTSRVRSGSPTTSMSCAPARCSRKARAMNSPTTWRRWSAAGCTRPEN